MDFTFDAEQLALRDVARQALERELDGNELRRLADDADGVTGALWERLVELGWVGLLVPEADGGAGAGLLQASIVLEQMGRLPLPGPFFSSAVAATLAARALGVG
ncbi:MAG: acyl-CoA dehydrogenase family protein, partial [Acidimicrobiales bacterium]